MEILKPRKCSINFEIAADSRSWQDWSFSFDKDTHTFSTSAAVSTMLGDFINSLYDLYLEFIIDFEEYSDHCRYTQSVNGNPENPHQITGTKASFTWDNEGNNLDWVLYRNVSNSIKDSDNMVSIDLNYDFGEKVFHYDARFLDLCYAVTKATTKLLKSVGISGYRCMADGDDLNITKFLRLKYLSLTGKTSYLRQIESYRQASSLNDELNLLLFDM